jgi:Flp pilus assembly protein TadD
VVPAVGQFGGWISLVLVVARYHSDLGNMLLAQGNLDEAVSCYRRAIDLKPDFPDAHNNHGYAFQQQGRLDEAVACDRRAIELKPDDPAVNRNLGNMLKQQRRLDDLQPTHWHGGVQV